MTDRRVSPERRESIDRRVAEVRQLAEDRRVAGERRAAADRRGPDVNPFGRLYTNITHGPIAFERVVIGIIVLSVLGGVFYSGSNMIVNVTSILQR